MTERASLTWRLRRGEGWLTATSVMPASSAARVAVVLLREFAERAFTPADVEVTDDVRRFQYKSDRMTVAIRRLDEPAKGRRSVEGPTTRPKEKA